MLPYRENSFVCVPLCENILSSLRCVKQPPFNYFLKLAKRTKTQQRRLPKMPKRRACMKHTNFIGIIYREPTKNLLDYLYKICLFSVIEKFPYEIAIYRCMYVINKNVNCISLLHQISAHLSINDSLHAIARFLVSNVQQQWYKNTKGGWRIEKENRKTMYFSIFTFYWF